jgi:hypothetical protein
MELRIYTLISATGAAASSFVFGIRLQEMLVSHAASSCCVGREEEAGI